MIKFFKERHLDGESLPSILVLPIPIKEGGKFLSVPMAKNAEWHGVNFNSDYDGICTSGLTYCASISIVKTNNKGMIEKAWMIHLPGGFHEGYMPDLLPEPWVTGKFQMIATFGSSDHGLINATHNDDTLNKIMEKYQQQGIEKTDINTVSTPDGGIAISKSGCIGLTPHYSILNVPPIKVEDKYATLNQYLGRLDNSDYEREKEFFLKFIELSPTKQQPQLRSIYEKIINQGESDYNSAAKALVFTRHFLCGLKNQQEATEYKKEMNFLGTSWGKIALLVVASFLVVPAIYTVPKLRSIFQHHTQRNVIADNLLSMGEEEGNESDIKPNNNPNA